MSSLFLKEITSAREGSGGDKKKKKQTCSGFIFLLAPATVRTYFEKVRSFIIWARATWTV